MNRPVDPAVTRWRLDLAYDGTDFHGWARQPERRTVQGTIEEWLPKVLRLPDPVRLTCAGRTDAGVHARGQVCHVDLPTGAITDDGSILIRRLARVLPGDVVVTAVRPAPAGFDARFAAIWRRYCYRLVDRTQPPDPLSRRSVAHWPGALDLDRLNAAAAGLLGLQDFAAFCRRRDGATTVRTLITCEARRVEISHGEVIELTVVADAFCHSMVRSLTGALVRVGSGARDPDWLPTVARQGAERVARHGAERAAEHDSDRSSTPSASASGRGARDPGIIVMPPHGLTLEEVGYPDDDQLARRVQESRSVREPVPALATGQPQPAPESR